MQKVITVIAILIVVKLQAQIPIINIDAQKKLYTQRESAASTTLKELLAQQRVFIQKNNFNFNISNTAASQLKINITNRVYLPSIKEIANITSGKVQNVNNGKASLITSAVLPNIPNITTVTSLSSFDSRAAITFPPVQDNTNGRVRGIYDMLTIALSKKQKLTNISSVDFCINQCQNTIALLVFSRWGKPPPTASEIIHWVTTNKLLLQSDTGCNGSNSLHPFDGSLSSQYPPNSKLANVNAYTLVVNAYNQESLPINEIKHAVFNYGAVLTSFNSSPLFLNFAGGGVFNEAPSFNSSMMSGAWTEYPREDPMQSLKDAAEKVRDPFNLNGDRPDPQPIIHPGAPILNHFLLIVGWNDAKQAWLVKNCWTNNWGDSGYAWVNYYTNNIGAENYYFVPY